MNSEGSTSSLLLSGIARDNEGMVSSRDEDRLLRPIFINGVEVGYAYSQNENDKRLAVRGITIALFHFISAGHQALALLPHCFKLYRNKSTHYDELLALHRMNLVEFTPGHGADKYVEVNRLCAWASYESGGCVVARSQMHPIVSENPCLEEVVEKRLLMPSFMGDDIIFPMDGPLGRIGLPLSETLSCLRSSIDFSKCLLSQLRLIDQRLWIQKLSSILPEKLSWSTLSNRLNSWNPDKPVCMPAHALDIIKSVPFTPLAGPIRPPETNSHIGRGFANARRRRPNTKDYYNCPERMRNKDVMTEVDDDQDLFLPAYAHKESRDVPSISTSSSSPPSQPSLPSFSSSSHPSPNPSSANIEDPSESHIGRPGSLYRIASVYEMARRERDLSSSQEARVVRGHHNASYGGGLTAVFSTVSPPSTVPSKFTTRRRFEREHFPPSQQSDELPSSSSSTYTRPPSADHSAIFTQLALIVGFEKAKRVTDKNPNEVDVNKLVNLALDDSPTVPSPPHFPPQSSSPTPPIHPLSSLPNLSSSPRTHSLSSSDESTRRYRGGRRNRKWSSPRSPPLTVPPSPPSPSAFSPSSPPQSSTIQSRLSSPSTISSVSTQSTIPLMEDLIDWNADVAQSTNRGSGQFEASTHLLDL